MSATRVAVIDNYDSFTYNLVQYLGQLECDVHVFRNDEVSVEELASHEALVISPGPGRPEDAGVSIEAIRDLSGRIPILGVCLGHQCLGEAFGGEIVRNQPVHGKTSLIRHDGTGPFTGLPSPFEATRYHSLVIATDSMPDVLVANAWTEDGIVMGVRHVSHPTYGVQFHPESVLTLEGMRLLANFVAEGGR